VGRSRLLPLILLATAIFVGSLLISPGFANVQPPSRFFGVGLSRATKNKEYGEMQRGGVSTVRVVFDWRQIQPSSTSPFQWSAADHLVRLASDHDISVFPQLIATPDWLSSQFTKPPIFKGAVHAWRNFVSAAVSRYGTGGTFWSQNPGVPYHPILDWQIWNEENSPGFFYPKPSVHQYAKLLAISAKPMHRTDPNARLVLGGMFESSGKDGAILSWKYLKKLYKVGAAGDFDIVSVHPYSPTLKGFRFQLEKIRATMRRHQDRSPIWIDEIGWASARHGSPYAKGKNGQARMLRRAYTFALHHRRALGIGRMMWYPLRDTQYVPAQCVLCKTSGLFTRKGAAKPSWTAYQRLAR
jgi:hypothetical protein